MEHEWDQETTAAAVGGLDWAADGQLGGGCGQGEEVAAGGCQAAPKGSAGLHRGGAEPLECTLPPLGSLIQLAHLCDDEEQSAAEQQVFICLFLARQLRLLGVVQVTSGAMKAARPRASLLHHAACMIEGQHSY